MIAKYKKPLSFFTIFAFMILSVTLLAGVASAITIFSDGFETDLSAWTPTQDSNGNNWVISTSGDNSEGSQHAELNPAVTMANTNPAIIEINIDTTGFENIVFSYDRKLIGLDVSGGTDEFKADYSVDGGNNWINVETDDSADDANYVSKSFNLQFSADDNSNFMIRFQCNLDRDNEFCKVDKVLISGSVIPAPSLSITPSTQTIPIGENWTITVENDGNTNLNDIELSKVSGDFDVQFDVNNFNLNAGSTQDVIVTPTNVGNVGFGGKSVIIKAKADDETQDTVTLIIQGSFCREGQLGTDLVITDIDIDAPGNDEEWELLDDVEIEVEVENIGVDDIDDVIIEMGLFDSAGINQVGDLDFKDTDEEEQEVGDVDEGDDEKAIFKFRVPADIDDGIYTLVFKAFPDGDEDEICTQEIHTETIDIQRVDDREEAVVVEDIKFPHEATCGEALSGTFTVFNIGEDDEDQVLVRIFNSDFNLNEELIIREDLDEGDDEKLSFSFIIPLGLEDGLYFLNFITEYDYDDDDNEYDETSEDTFTHSIRLIGCSALPTPTITGNVIIQELPLDSTPTAGEEFSTSFLITNTGDDAATFIINAQGYESWADSVSISERIISLDVGESATITFTFEVNEDASGSQSFLIETTSNGQIELQEVEVNIKASAAGAKGFTFEGNNLIWVIAIINIILIILIILVAVRLSRR